jgi:protein phosphatase 2C family protein 2/3
MSRNGEVIDRSGSCAVITFIVDDICYIANVGDSRAVLSKSGGKDIIELTNDHKPNDPSEKKRIIENGGKVYQ